MVRNGISPLRDLMTMRDSMDRLLDDHVSQLPGLIQRSSRGSRPMASTSSSRAAS
jgi:hypothetical protein